jgi:hypothetical protein
MEKKMSDYGDFTPIKVGCSTMRSPEDFPADIRKAAFAVVARGYDEGLVEVVCRALMERDRAATEDAKRYRWLRAGNAYAPEEALCTGGEELDELCDRGLRSQP